MMLLNSREYLRRDFHASVCVLRGLKEAIVCGAPLHLLPLGSADLAASYTHDYIVRRLCSRRAILQVNR